MRIQKERNLTSKHIRWTHVRWRDVESSVLKLLAKYGFLFFLVKGLIWLVVPVILAIFFGAD